MRHEAQAPRRRASAAGARHPVGGRLPPSSGAGGHRLFLPYRLLRPDSRPSPAAGLRRRRAGLPRPLVPPPPLVGPSPGPAGRRLAPGGAAAVAAAGPGCRRPAGGRGQHRFRQPGAGLHPGARPFPPRSPLDQLRHPARPPGPGTAGRPAGAGRRAPALLLAGLRQLLPLRAAPPVHLGHPGLAAPDGPGVGVGGAGPHLPAGPHLAPGGRAPQPGRPSGRRPAAGRPQPGHAHGHLPAPRLGRPGPTAPHQSGRPPGGRPAGGERPLRHWQRRGTAGRRRRLRLSLRRGAAALLRTHRAGGGDRPHWPHLPAGALRRGI